jgi:Zn-dependent peptidase ImmA (M78 family)
MQVKDLSIKEIDKITEQVLVVCGLTIKQGTFDEGEDLQGAFDRKSKTVYLAAEDDYPSKNFTLAHEIGHFKLHKEVKTDVFTMYQLKNLLDRDAKDPVEIQADMFASSLLMPKKVFSKFWDVTRSIPTLTLIFGVPAIAVRMRLSDLKLK